MVEKMALKTMEKNIRSRVRQRARADFNEHEQAFALWLSEARKL
jgi:hypothetical protein